jgi:hypothetical protein
MKWRFSRVIQQDHPVLSNETESPWVRQPFVAMAACEAMSPNGRVSFGIMASASPLASHYEMVLYRQRDLALTKDLEISGDHVFRWFAVPDVNSTRTIVRDMSGFPRVV